MCAETLLGQTIPIEWVQQAGSTAEENVSRSGSLAIDAQGNCFITGSCGPATVFGTTTLPGFGGTDIFLAKYDTSGKLLWVRAAGGANDDVGSAVALDAAGNAYTTGYFRNTASFGTNVLIANHATDMFIAVYNTDGDLRWLKQYGVGGSELAENIAIDNNGALYVCGEFLSRTTSIGGILLTNAYQGLAAGLDIFLAKFDNDGNVLWAQRAGGGQSNDTPDYAPVVRLGDSGNVYLAGFTASSSITFGPYSFSNPNLYNMPYLVKYDPDGVVIWARKLFASGFGAVSDLAVDSLGNSHIIGQFDNNVTIDSQTLTNARNAVANEAFVAKFNANGSLVWALAGGGADWDLPAAIALDSQGNCYVAGAYSGPFKWGQLTLPAIGSSYAACIFKIDSAGTARWGYGAGSSSGTLGRAIIADASGNTYVAGMFGGILSLGQTNLASRGAYDLFLLKGPRPPPAITSQPQSQTVTVGDTVTFSVVAVGEPPLTYQWLFNGTNIFGAVGATLTLTNTTHAQAGFYSVIVSNQAGVVTSAVVQLLFNFLMLKMYAGLTIDGESGQSFQVQYVSALGNQTNWQTLTNVTLTNVSYLFIDVQSPTVPRRFYRAIPLP